MGSQGGVSVHQVGGFPFRQDSWFYNEGCNMHGKFRDLGAIRSVRSVRSVLFRHWRVGIEEARREDPWTLDFLWWWRSYKS